MTQANTHLEIGTSLCDEITNIEEGYATCIRSAIVLLSQDHALSIKHDLVDDLVSELI